MAIYTHKHFQRDVCRLAALNGWRYYFTHNSIRSPHGFPDLVLVGPDYRVRPLTPEEVMSEAAIKGVVDMPYRMITAELKTPQYSRRTKEQVAWGDAISRVQSVDYRVYFPEDLGKGLVALDIGNNPDAVNLRTPGR